MELKKGINLGGFLSQCEHTMLHHTSFIGEEDIRIIANWGLDHVRLPIDYEVLENEDGSSKIEGYALVQMVVEWCLKYDLNIILDLHKAPGYDFNNAGNTAANSLFTSVVLQDRFVNLWKNIARNFAQYKNVAFELLNEVVEEENVDLWNALIERSVTQIRKIAPVTPIIYGGIRWNSASTLKYLKKPEDPNIIFTFHFYEPLLFTHQKARWLSNIDKNMEVSYPDDMEWYRTESAKIGIQGIPVRDAKATDIGEAFITEMVQEAVDAANKAGVPIYCGEFGVIDQAPIQDTLRWYEVVNKVFGKYGIGLGAWTYKLMDFGITDSHYAQIRKSLIDMWSH